MASELKRCAKFTVYNLVKQVEGMLFDMANYNWKSRMFVYGVSAFAMMWHVIIQ